MISPLDAAETELEPNNGFEARWSRVQTILQGLIGLIVVAGLIGVFGQGWLSKAAQAFPAAPLNVTYERLLRANAPAEIIVAVTRPLASEMLQIEVGSDLLDHASINATQPRATSVDATPLGVTYSFRLGPERQGSITFKLAPRRVGRVEAELSSQGDRLRLPLFIYP